jgi:spoIIIJ-associated protein
MTGNTKADKASTTLATMLDYLGLNAVVKAEERNGKIVLVTYSEEAGRIIGKKGQSLQSLELLVNRMAIKEDNESSWITIDVDGYSSGRSAGRRDGYKKDFRKDDRNDRGDRGDRGDRRPSYSRNDDNRGDRRQGGGNREFMSEEQLNQMALDAAKETKRWGDPVTLKPMNAHDRRIIHMTLKEDSEIDTQSKAVKDSDKLKRVVVCLKGK